MSAGSAAGAGMRLVERLEGVGELIEGDREHRGIAYRIERYQGFASSGLPVPGVHRIDGELVLDSVADAERLVGARVSLRVDDGRVLNLALVEASGRVLAEGHGPSRCVCC